MIANPRPYRHRVLLARIATALVVCGLIATIVSVRISQEYDSRILPNVYIQSTPVGGLSFSEVELLFEEKNKSGLQKEITLLLDDTPVATISMKQLGAELNSKEAYDKAFLVGRSSHLPSRLIQYLGSLSGLSHFHFPLGVSYNRQPILDVLLALAENNDRAPIDARFQFTQGRVVSFQKESSGIKIEREQSMKDVNGAIERLFNTRQQKAVVPIQKTILKPRITLAQTNTFGIQEEIGRGVSNYSHSIPERIHNLILGSTKFNGVLIPPNTTLSFNSIIGDISALTGYKPAYIIKEGKTVLGDGGGVCQVSTTLFRAALNAGLPIEEHHFHAYRVSYYENDSTPGLDSTVFAPSVDLKIRNNTATHILIQTAADTEHNLLTFILYGKKDGRIVELEQPRVFGIAPPPEPLYQDDPTLKKGSVKQVDFAAWGGKSAYKYKVRRDNSVLFEKDFFASYKPWRSVFLVGTSD